VLGNPLRSRPQSGSSSIPAALTRSDESLPQFVSSFHVDAATCPLLNEFHSL